MQTDSLNSFSMDAITAPEEVLVEATKRPTGFHTVIYCDGTSRFATGDVDKYNSKGQWVSRTYTWEK